MRSCITHRSNLVKFIARYSIFYGRVRSPVGRNMLYCAQRYSCAVEDLLFTQSARKTVSSRVRERLSDEQLLTARLLQECIMVRVETVWLVCLMLLRLVICLILFVTCVCADCSVFLSVLSFLLWSPYVIGQTIHIFILWFLSFYLSIFFSSPNLSGRRLDVYHTSTHGVALVRI